MCTRASKAPFTQHAAQQNRENTKLLVRASFGASLYTTAHEQHEWPPRVSGRTKARVEAKHAKVELQLHPSPLPTELFIAPSEAKKAVHFTERKLREDLATRRHHAEAARKKHATHERSATSELTQAQRCPGTFPRCTRGLT